MTIPRNSTSDWSCSRRVVTCALALALLTTALSYVMVVQSARPASAATGDYSCGESLLYGTGATSNGADFDSIDTTTGTVTKLGVFTLDSSDPNKSWGGPYMNALAVSKDGSAAYALNTSPTNTSIMSSFGLYRFDVSAKKSVWVGKVSGVSLPGVKAGGTDPTTGQYWIAGPDSNSNPTTFLVYSIDLATLTTTLRFKTPAAGGGNADLAFDARGNLYLAMSGGTTNSNRLMEYGHDQINAGGASLGGTQLATLSPSSKIFPAMAFGADGYLYTSSLDTADSSSSVLYQTNPSNGLVSTGWPKSLTSGNPIGDLGSCATPNTLTVQVKFASKVSANDQFQTTIDATNGLDPTTTGRTGTTSGTNLGLHTGSSEIAGPVLVFQNKTYSFSTTRADGLGTSGYAASYTCNNASGTELSSAASNIGAVKIPRATGTGVNVTCTITVRVGAPHLNLSVSSTSTPTRAGDQVTYTYQVISNGNEKLTAITISDPLVAGSAFTCASGNADVDQTITCTGVHTVTQAEVDVGVIRESATASASGALSGKSASDTASMSISIGTAPQLSASLGASVGAWKNGGTVTWSAVLTNNGNVTLSSLTIVDSLATTWTCQATKIAPGASVVCTSTYVLTRANVSVGSVSDTANSTAKDPSGHSVAASATGTASVPRYSLPTGPRQPATDCPDCAYY